jgi:hypothetical protein
VDVAPGKKLSCLPLKFEQFSKAVALLAPPGRGLLWEAKNEGRSIDDLGSLLVNRLAPEAQGFSLLLGPP